MQRVAVVFLWLLIASVFAAFYGIGYMHVTSNKIKVPVRENKIINGDSHTGGSSVGDVSPGDTEERQRSINSVKMKDNQIREDATQANKTVENVRILCWIMTSPGNLNKRAKHVKNTWGKRCNVLLFFSSVKNDSFPAIGLNVLEGRDHLTAKTMASFQYVYEHYFDKADWFMKADDDTYVILENLRYFLSAENPEDPVFFGHHFKAEVKQGYYSGGAGYVISKEALKRYGEKAKFHPGCPKDGGAEDVQFAKCMQNLGVKTGDSTDTFGRSRFHCFHPNMHLKGNYWKWYLRYDSHGAKTGAEYISDYAISFHYVTPEQMYLFELFIYQLSVYDGHSGQKDLNRKKS